VWGTPYRASVFFNTLQSDNYNASVPYAGWQIVRDTGAATFNQVTVRGNLDAGSVTTSNLFFRNSTGAISSVVKDATSGANLNSVGNAGYFVWESDNLGSSPWYSENFFLAGPSYHTTGPLGTSTAQSRRIPRADELKVLMTLNCQVDHYLSLIIKPNWTFNEPFYNDAGAYIGSKTYNANTWTNVGPDDVVGGVSYPIVGIIENQSGYGTATLSYVLTLSNVPANGLIYFGASVGGQSGYPKHGGAPLNSGSSAIKSLNYSVISFNT
jgi:hypothetical protein